MAAHSEAIIMSHQLLGDYDYCKVIREMSTPIVIVKTPNDSSINKILEKECTWLTIQQNVTIEEKAFGGHLVNMEYPEEYNSWLKGYISVNKLIPKGGHHVRSQNQTNGFKCN